MPSPKTPAQLHKEKLARRARKALIEAKKTIGRLTAAQKKSPSQKKSEGAKKKDAERAGVQVTKSVEPNSCDCRGCTKCGPYGWDLKSDMCTERSIIAVCAKCGQKVRARVIVGCNDVYRCPVCIAQVR